MMWHAGCRRGSSIIMGELARTRAVFNHSAIDGLVVLHHRLAAQVGGISGRRRQALLPSSVPQKLPMLNLGHVAARLSRLGWMARRVTTEATSSPIKVDHRLPDTGSQAQWRPPAATTPGEDTHASSSVLRHLVDGRRPASLLGEAGVGVVSTVDTSLACAPPTAGGGILSSLNCHRIAVDETLFVIARGIASGATAGW